MWISNMNLSFPSLSLSLSLSPPSLQLWKRSGAWFNNALPVIDISQAELEKFEEEQKVLYIHAIISVRVYFFW